MDNKEIRISQVDELRTVSPTDSNEMIVEGYALKYDTWSQDLGGFIETIDKRALDNADMSNVIATIDHDPSKILGRLENQTLELEADDVGLRFKAKLPNTTYAKDLYENIRVGNIGQCSFGFVLDKNGDNFEHDKETGLYKRTIRSFKRIFDITITGTPAYEDTNVAPAMRSIENMKKELEAHKLEQEKLQLELDLMRYSI